MVALKNFGFAKLAKNFPAFMELEAILPCSHEHFFTHSGQTGSSQHLHTHFLMRDFDIVKDFINALPGNSSVNTVRHANNRGSRVFCRSDRRVNRLGG
jgi:hypothetical protein